MGISDYRNKDFRVSFARVTPPRCACEVRRAIATYRPATRVFCISRRCFTCGKIVTSVVLRAHTLAPRTIQAQALSQRRCRLACGRMANALPKKKTVRTMPDCFTMSQFALLTLVSNSCFRLTCRAWRSDASNARPCGSRCSCERCRAEPRASARVPHSPSP